MNEQQAEEIFKRHENFLFNLPGVHGLSDPIHTENQWEIIVSAENIFNIKNLVPMEIEGIKIVLEESCIASISPLYVKRIEA